MFKSNKSNQLPNVWKNVKVKRKKPEHSVTTNDNSSHNGESKICLEFAPAPDPELVASDDEVVSYIIKCCKFFIKLSCRLNFYNLLKMCLNKLLKINKEMKKV